ncbi:HNH endonuclease [Bradyrhizobium sp. BRP22]|uniref:HNH endonuclease n=1 Tax=Bradyrhizobium sp. BRP22 TaxID=2793821 RepID=UPI001CD3D183|nr:HNH endonuclease [Bradyrhizobium sp. BRP22]MCA1452145.1 HNH endonuclease [Bradyrhizobium sp. BRP22]
MDESSTRTQWQHFYDTAVWQRLRRLQLTHEPLCKMCLARGVVTPARVADHVEPHNGDWNKFRLGPLQSLCFDCHDIHKRRIDLHGYSSDIDDDGWPIDPRHPANKVR